MCLVSNKHTKSWLSLFKFFPYFPDVAKRPNLLIPSLCLSWPYIVVNDWEIQTMINEFPNHFRQPSIVPCQQWLYLSIDWFLCSFQSSIAIYVCGSTPPCASSPKYSLLHLMSLGPFTSKLANYSTHWKIIFSLAAQVNLGFGSWSGWQFMVLVISFWPVDMVRRAISLLYIPTVRDMQLLSFIFFNRKT